MDYLQANDIMLLHRSKGQCWPICRRPLLDLPPAKGDCAATARRQKKEVNI
jgi:hypothetical protein